MNNETFNYEAWKNGEYNKGKGGAREAEFQMFASLRLLLESGQEISDEALQIIKDMSCKWYYYKKISDENKGNIIIGLHKKDLAGWLYLIIDTQTGEELGHFTKIQDAKSSFKLQNKE